MNQLDVCLVNRSDWPHYEALMKTWNRATQEVLFNLPSSLDHSATTERLSACFTRCVAISCDLKHLKPSPDWEFYVCRNPLRQEIDDNNIEGVMLLHMGSEDERPYLEIEQLTTHPGNLYPFKERFVQKGIGTALVHKCFQRAIERNAAQVCLSSTPSAREFYRHLGFGQDFSSTYFTLSISIEKIRSIFAKAHIPQ